jgi:uncharacterized protein YidB (DUF937 family)
MGALDSLAGAGVNAELARAVESFIQKLGGVSGLVKKFEAEGLGEIAQSWKEKGQNRPITSAQIYRALGFQTLAELGSKLGLSPDATAAKLAEFLPKAVAKLAVSANRPAYGARKLW